MLSGITLSELQNLVNIREEANRPIPALRQNVQQLIQNYENNIIQPPPQFRDSAPIPAPRTKKQRPVADFRVQSREQRRALKGFTKSCELSITKQEKLSMRKKVKFYKEQYKKA